MKTLAIFLTFALAQAQVKNSTTTTTTNSVKVTSTSASSVPSSAPASGPPLGTSGPLGPSLLGNCLTQKIDFTDPSRIFSLDGLNRPDWDFSDKIDISRYDMTVDYYKNQVQMSGKGGVSLKISANPDPKQNALAPRLSTTRFMRGGVLMIVGPNLPDTELDLKGTDPNSGDEIDWEIVGGDATHAQSNVFYRGFKEFGVRGGFHNITVTEKHKYTIDWRHDKIIWSIDDVVVRTYSRDDKTAAVAQNPNRRFFPDRAQKIQFALWSDLNNAWAGGAPKFPAGSNSAVATYDYVDIQCYDDNE
ncbi:hypothetical protein HDV03_003488 [Kappamyces sp. JEL0829]|nr:hypothetical protein HDV03_003488 [Kappamyces sp. JEL0829]